MDESARAARRRLLQFALASPLAAAGIWTSPLGRLLAQSHTSARERRTGQGRGGDYEGAKIDSSFVIDRGR